MLTTRSPMVMATTVVMRYSPMVRPPIAERLERSFKSDTPLIKEARMSGMAINFNMLIKMVPKGLIQSTIKPFQPILAPKTPKSTPNNMPSKICQCRGIFFMLISFSG